MLGLVSVVKILKLCTTCIYVGMGYIGINGFVLNLIDLKIYFFHFQAQESKEGF